MRTYPYTLVLVPIACNSMCRAQSLGTNIQPSAEAHAQADQKRTILKIHQDAFEHPFDEARLKAYMQSLPRVDDYYIVEGDISMSEQELRGYVLTKSKAAASRQTDKQTSELMLITRNGTPDFLKGIDERSLSYVIDKKSFSSPERYDVAVRNMGQATKDWMAVLEGMAY